MSIMCHRGKMDCYDVQKRQNWNVYDVPERQTGMSIMCHRGKMECL